MSKLITVALLVGGLIFGAVPVMASAQQVQGGIADPNTLAASGVILPFFTSGIIGSVATIQAASPVGENLNAHMFFYDKFCTRVGPSVGIELTTNDVQFQQVADTSFPIVPIGTDGLVLLAGSDDNGFTLIPLDNPVHTRMYLFNSSNGRSHVINPIIVNSAEFPSVQHWYSPLRTGATFFAPLQTSIVGTDLLLICPLSSIVGAPGAGFGADQNGGSGEFTFTTTGFPQINPRLPSSQGNIRVRIYDVNEHFKRDVTITCTCTTIFHGIEQITSFYQSPEVADGTYTELVSQPAAGAQSNPQGLPINSGPRTSFTGYVGTSTLTSAVNAFFAPLHSGSQLSIDGCQPVGVPVGTPCVPGVTSER